MQDHGHLTLEPIIFLGSDPEILLDQVALDGAKSARDGGDKGLLADLLLQAVKDRRLHNLASEGREARRTGKVSCAQARQLYVVNVGQSRQKTQ